MRGHVGRPRPGPAPAGPPAQSLGVAGRSREGLGRQVRPGVRPPPVTEVSPTAPRTGLIQWPGSTRARRGTGDSPRNRAPTEAGRCCPPGDTQHSLGHLVGHAGMEWVEAQCPQAQGGPKCPQCPGSPGQRLSEGRSVGGGAVSKPEPCPRGQARGRVWRGLCPGNDPVGPGTLYNSLSPSPGLSPFFCPFLFDQTA